MSNIMLIEVSREFLDDHISQPMKKVQLIKEQFTNQLFNLNWKRAKETEDYSMNDLSYFHLNKYIRDICEMELGRLVYLPYENNEYKNRVFYKTYYKEENGYFIWDTDEIFKELKITLAKD